MKSSILAVALCAVPAFVQGSLGNNGHSKSLLSFRRHDSHKRHAALTPSQKLTMVKKRRSLYARKTPGNGDVTEEPDNIAEGTYTKDQGCAVRCPIVLLLHYLMLRADLALCRRRRSLPWSDR